MDSTKGLTSSNSNNYLFNNVPKYSTSDGHVYNYTVSQSEAVSKTSPEDKYTTTQNTYNFTNVLGNTDKDADNKGLVVKGSIYWEDKGDASLKGMETIINNDLSVSYGNNYNGQVYNLSANNIGTVLSSMNSGKPSSFARR